MSTLSGRESGLAPLVGENPKVLLLGSFPSRMSLEKGLYYANPRNHFWNIMRIILDHSREEEIYQTYSGLKDHHIAVWDVIESREFQPGSMDHDIRNASMNDIPGFLEMYPTIRFIGLNGSKAWTCFLKVIHEKNIPNNLVFRRLPSTSPANARYSLDEKIREWHIILEYL